MKKVKNLCQVLCILAVFVSFTNCQNDTVSEMQHEEILQKEFPFKTTLLSKQDIATNSKLSNLMRNLKIIQSSDASKSVYNAMYDFTIDTDAVKLIESTENNTHSYTFPIERSQPNDSELENLVFMYDEATDNYSASLVTYHFSQTQLQEFINTGHITSSSYNISYELIDTNIDDILNKNMTVPCTTTYTTYHITPDTNETFLYSTNGVVQNACEHENDDDPCDTYTVIVIDCPDGGGTANTSHGTDDYSNNTSSSSSTNGGGTQNNGSDTPNDSNDEHYDIITSPTPKDELEQIANIMNEVVGEGNWTINQNEEPSEDAPILNSIAEAQAFLDALTEGEFEFESSEDADTQGTNKWEHFRMTFSESTNTYLKASIKRKTYPQGTLGVMEPSDILGVRTRVIGNTTIYNWTQIDDEDISNVASSPSIEVRPEYNSMVIKVNAEMEIDTAVFGRSITMIRSIIVEINYNIITGELDTHYTHWYFDDNIDD